VFLDCVIIAWYVYGEVKRYAQVLGKWNTAGTTVPLTLKIA